MPTKRKRIGYLPSQNVQELIIQIANKEKLSQSKLVGILVEEALSARGIFQPPKYIDKNNKDIKDKKININQYSSKYEDIDEMISDKGITYNKTKYNMNPSNSKNINSSRQKNESSQIFKHFNHFLKFQNMSKEE